MYSQVTEAEENELANQSVYKSSWMLASKELFLRFDSTRKLLCSNFRQQEVQSAKGGAGDVERHLCTGMQEMADCSEAEGGYLLRSQVTEGEENELANQSVYKSSWMLASFYSYDKLK